MEKLVFIVDDEPSIRKLLTHWVKNQWGYEIATFENGLDMLKELEQNPALVLLDIMLPDSNGVELIPRIKSYNPNLPIIMLSAQGSIEVAVESLRRGAFDYFPKPLDSSRLEPAIKNAINNFHLHQQVEHLQDEVEQKYSFDNIISNDPRMQTVFKLVSKILDNEITVLINGESGTGKELVARAIHYNGNRKDQPFIVVNCASIPRELLESELFGHEKGSFTGAHQRKLGKFEAANGGTLFLDEIGEMEMALQAKILRVIQEREFERVGGNETLKVDVRILSATNRDLKEMVENNEFREDLYYRLSSFPIVVPSLRNRRGDIVVLVNHFIEKFNQKVGTNIKGVSKKAMKFIYDYDWPGNIRELENTIERCIILTDTDEIDVDVLPEVIVSPDINKQILKDGTMFTETSPIIPFEKLKEEAIKHALDRTNGNVVEAARKLNIGRATMYRLMEKYSLDVERR